MTNIIKFPGVAEIPFEKTDAANRIEEVRAGYAEECSEECFEALMTIARSFGFFNNTSKIHLKDMVIISEILNITMLRYAGVHHPLQDIIDDLVDLKEEEAPGGTGGITGDEIGFAAGIETLV